MARLRALIPAFLFTGLLGSFFILYNCSNKENGLNPRKNELQSFYVGRNACVECHIMESELFHDSDHDLAMDSATEKSVLGDFNNTTFTHFGVTSRFFRENGDYYVHTEGPEGVMQDYKISFTFGVRPLQQYLISFPDGAYQCLPIAWDSRSVEEGGQKWFHLYGNERIAPDDILYWTRTSQNWNYMCSECHSTNTQKNYDKNTGKYHTSWNEIDVSCEACHGPGSLHLDWASKVEQGAAPDLYTDMGLVVRLKDRDNATWVFDPDSTTARRSVPRVSDELVQMCGRCHSRRSILTEDYYHGGSLLDSHWPSLLDEGLYFADGQIEDEVYVYGSFLQSKMYKSGVVCKDCHEPHSGKIYVEGNGLCYRCHLASEYGGRNHHFHEPSGEGASCVECHMHERTYMQIDPRRDHSIRIPRPDLSEKLGTPNACNQCHADKSTTWASNYMGKWYGKEFFKQEHYGEVFWAARRAYPEASTKLQEIAIDRDLPPMIRATAVALLGSYSDPAIYTILSKTIVDVEPLIRYASLNVLQYATDDYSKNMIIQRLSDSTKLVRIMAANALSSFDLQMLPKDVEKAYAEALKEYISSLDINADHPGTHVNYGNLYLNQGNFEAAEKAYRKAIELEPGLVTPYINLADLYRRQNREQEGELVLITALEKYPDLAAVNYALGLLKIREDDHKSGLIYLKKAAQLAPEIAQYSYVYGIGLNSEGAKEEAYSFLASALKSHPYDRQLLYALCTISIENNEIEKAKEYAGKLIDYYPEDRNYKELFEYLQQPN